MTRSVENVCGANFAACLDRHVIEPHKYESGREGDMPLTGFFPRKQSLTLYIMSGFAQHVDLLDKLGKFRTGKSCLYIKRLKDVDLGTLRELIAQSVEHVKSRTSSLSESPYSRDRLRPASLDSKLRFDTLRCETQVRGYRNVCTCGKPRLQRITRTDC